MTAATTYSGRLAPRVAGQSRSESPTMPRPAGHAAVGRWVLLLHLVLSPLFFCTWTAEVFEGPKAALLTAAALILTGLAACAWVGRGIRLRPRLRMDLATL